MCDGRAFAGNRSRRPVVMAQKCNFHITDETELLSWIEITHAPFVEIDHAARSKWTNIVDFDDDTLFAALDQRKGGSIIFAIADTTKLLPQIDPNRRSPRSWVIRLPRGGLFVIRAISVKVGVIGRSYADDGSRRECCIFLDKRLRPNGQ